MADLLADAGFVAPSFGDVGQWALYFLGACVFACFIAMGVYFYIINLKFNKKIILFKKVSGKVIPVAKDKGMLERIGLAGDNWLRVKNFKKILPRPKIEMEKNTYWYFEREDGEWINFCLDDMDAVMKTAKAYYVDEDMRLQRLGIQRNLKDRFEKSSFWDKYGNMIMGILFMMIVTICLIVIFNKINDLVKALPQLAHALESLANAIASNYNDGMIPVNSTGVPI